MAIELRDYQVEVVEKVVNLYKQNTAGRAKFVWATGLGKTVGFSAIAHEIRKISQTNVIIIAHREELLKQAAEKYQMIDPTAIIGQVGAGRHEWGAPVTVASIQTVSREEHLKALKRFNYGVVIIDEVHHCHMGNEYGKVINALPDAFIVGVTATDMRLDGRSNFEIFGAPIQQYGIIKGITNGHLCDLKAVALKTQTNLDNIKTTRNMDGEKDFNQKELENAIDTPVRNKRVVDGYLEHAAGRRAICFGVTVRHAENLAKTFRSQGVAAEALSGETSTEERTRMYAALRSGKLLVLCSVQVLTEGFDEPLVSCIIMARPTQSTSLFLQCIGRGTRLAPGKRDCLLLDLTDNVFNHRLEPVTLSKALGKMVKDKESVSQALEREKKERAEREAQVRKLYTNRNEDVVFNLVQAEKKLTWIEKSNGMFVLEVGREKHRIALVPNDKNDGTYSVWARLAPFFEGQRWLENAPLSWAQQFAEKKAKMLLEDPTSIGLIDRHAAWRNHKIDPDGKQVKFLEWKKIPWNAEMTKGEAADLIDEWKRKDEQRKSIRKMRKGA